MSTRWVYADVREPLICRNQKSLFGLDNFPQFGILPAAHPLIDNCAGFITPFRQPRGRHWRNVFIYLDAHILFCIWNEYFPAHDVGRVSKRGLNISRR